ncbi:outer membrane protein assembly factor BamA [Pelagicoccus sp. SDUM812002]|uniref:outer membrane protein assembly factor BamA n=1 Tax=Pelagicoccus sp. SDUM812002 TaxID=3041266 RepID=UPI00280DB890|nr:outer membrane protein assembly factor BamA [Pelagicoccus sp. SDUM812002]MDQ8186926.1 outer membrane protein assembly factor BamA [Pelagicoccus sp. SDUM812002]
MKITPNSQSHLARLSLALVLVVLSFVSASAQEANEAEPPTINKLIINFTGLSNVNEEVARANMSIREGEKYDPVAVDRDIRSLYRSNLFEYIEARIAPAGDNAIDVIFDIRPKFRISAIIFEGNDKLSNSKLKRDMSIVVNQVLNEPRVKGAAEDLQEMYLKKGFSQARVDYQIDRSPVTGFATVTFQIREGRKFKIGSINFVGNENVKKRKLKKSMETKKWGFLSVLTGSGRFDRDKFDDDLESLKDVYREEGYLDIDIDPAQVQFSYPSESRMRIDINVGEGKQYKVGNVEFVGNDTYEDSVLRLMLRVLPGTVYRPEKIDEDVARLEDFYGQFGFMETRVRMQRVPNVETGDIDIQYVVYESDKFQVESIDIEGNTKTKSVVVLRELALTPGSTFDSVRMDASRMRLDNTRYFEETNVTPQSTNVPGRKDLRVTFREGRTGNFSFGAGFSSLEKGVFFIELTQSNFDIFNWRGAFQGDGQKFRLKAQLGGRSSSTVIAFEEPWLFEQRLAFGLSVFNQSTDYDGLSYDTEIQGFDVSLRKRLIELIEGKLTYSYTSTEYSYPGSELLDPSDPDYEEKKAALEGQNKLLEASNGDISRVNLLLLRDTRDRIINSHRGMRLELDLHYAGEMLGGKFDFYKIETRNAFYIPLSEKLTQTLEFLVRAGVVDEFGDSTEDVPWNERFFLGGPNTLRGFEYRDVSPSEGGSPFNRPYEIGGKTYGMFGAEYSFGITEDFRIAAFYDGGFVNKEAGDFNIDADELSYEIFGLEYLPGRRRSGWNDNYGFGIRMSMMGTPLRLDYAIPMTTTGDSDVGGNDNGGQFNFTFGGRF